MAPQLKDPSLLKQDVGYVNGEWVKARSGKTFEVTGELPFSSSHDVSHVVSHGVSRLVSVLSK